VIDADVVGGAPPRDTGGGYFGSGLAMIPPSDIRDRIKFTRGMLGKHILAYVGDVVWEFLVLKHQYAQATQSPWMESQAVRSLKQAKCAGLLYRGDVLTDYEKSIVKWAITNSWRAKYKSNPVSIEQVGFEQYAAKCGFCSLLGYLYLDEASSDERLEAVAQEIGFLSGPQEEDQMLHQITGGIFPDPSERPPSLFFGALAPLGHVVLRLYVMRYLSRRPPRHTEFIYRVKLALRKEELDLAAIGFMRDDATAEEIELMQAAKDRRSTFGFSLQCLLGHLALNQPYRLHQVIANFGWAVPLPGT